MAKTVVGLYDQFDQAQEVVRELVAGGIERENISIVASDSKGEHASRFENRDETKEGAATGAGVGAVAGGLAGLLVGLGALAIPGVGPVLAAGPLVMALGGAGVGAVAGGIAGALTEAGVSPQEADIYAEGVRRGGTLVTVYATDEQADLAANVMNRYQPVDVQKRAENWREGNWNTFDEGAEPFAFDRTRLENERMQNEMPDQRSETQLYGDMESGAIPYKDERIETGEPGKRGYPDVESRFRQHFDLRYQPHGKEWDAFSEAYRYGFDHAHDQRSGENVSWDTVRHDLRRMWEEKHPGQGWEEYEEAVIEGWLAGKEQ